MWSSLNLSLVAGDVADAVLANRARTLGMVGADPMAWTSGQQVHGAGVVEVGEAERGAGAADPEMTLRGADALVTGVPGVALAVLVADCVPILVADPDRRRIAVIHAGWRGLVEGVVAAAVEQLAPNADAVAAIGPAIGPCCYEVSVDVADPLSDAFGADVVHDGRADLWLSAQRALRAAGVTGIVPALLCTRCEPQRFFSHRAGDTARQGLVAMLDAGD